MFCTVYQLRALGALLKPDDPLYLRGRDELLVYDQGRYKEMCAQLVDMETGAERLRLDRARVLKARDGGLLISGDEMRYRASKDKGTAYRQTWWCVPLARYVERGAPDGEAAPPVPMTPPAPPETMKRHESN